MYARVVRFTDVSPEKLEQRVAAAKAAGAPPSGMPSTGIMWLHDEAQGTAVVLQLFDTAEDMRAGAEVLNAMEPARAPGSRASVDMCEVKVERHV